MTGVRILFLMTLAIGVSGCSSPQKNTKAEPPPFMPTAFIKKDNRAPTNTGSLRRLASLQASSLQSIEPAAGMTAQQDYRYTDNKNKKENTYKPYTANSFKDIIKRDGCHIKDRFDRKAVLAYQWGRNRIGLDIDGIGYDSMDLEEIKMTYRLRLQNHKRKKEKCRYNSSWQGMIGSSINEFYKREDDTVMQRFDALKKAVKNRMDW